MSGSRAWARSDTICALATSAQSTGVGIVRISGPESLKILRRVTALKSADVEAHHLHFTRFVDADNKIIDEGYAAYMPGPRSYTAEDCVELQGHGGAVNLRRLLAAVVRAGARTAERGEFTMRAFLNGRIDLSQAEAVLDVVQAQTDTALDIAHDQLQGGLSGRIREILNQLIDVKALLEAQIDFVEEDLDEKHSQRPTEAIRAALRGGRELMAGFHRGQVLKSGVRVVLLGPPNAGKSSLFNALLRQSRAIVTDIPGTTRDFLEETVDLDGMPVTFVDTAGLRTPEDPVEAAGVERALALAESADIVLLLSDATAGVEATLPDSLSTKDNVISLLTKADLAPGDVSAVTGVGIDTIVEIIRRRALPEGSDQGVTAVVTSARHYEALKEAVEAMERAENASMRGETPDIISVEIQESLAQLGLIVGETTSEDLLDRIFSTFCIGK